MATIWTNKSTSDFQLVRWAPDVLLPENLTGAEGISELIRFEVDLLAETAHDRNRPEGIVGEKVRSRIPGRRSDTKGALYQWLLSTALSCGAATKSSFNIKRPHRSQYMGSYPQQEHASLSGPDQSVDVIKSVLGHYNISPSDDETSAIHTRPWSTARNTGRPIFNFFSRLMEQLGIFYYFIHTADDHKLTLQDSGAIWTIVLFKNTFRYAPRRGTSRRLLRFCYRATSPRSTTMVTGKYISWDYNFDHGIQADSEGGANETSENVRMGANRIKNSTTMLAARPPILKKRKPDSQECQDLDHRSSWNPAAYSGYAGTLALSPRELSNAICLQSGYTVHTVQIIRRASLNMKYLVTPFRASI